MISCFKFHGMITTKSGLVSASLSRMEDRDMRARQEFALLVGAAVDCIVEEIGPDATVIQQRIPLSGGSVTGDPLAVALGLDQKRQDLPFRLLDLFAEIGVAVQRIEPGVCLATEQFGDPFADRLRVVLGVPGIDPERAAMSGQFLDVEQCQPVGREDPVRGVKEK